MMVSRILPVLACIAALCCSSRTEEERLLARLDTLQSQWATIQADAARVGNQADLRRICRRLDRWIDRFNEADRELLAHLRASGVGSGAVNRQRQRGDTMRKSASTARRAACGVS